MHDDDTLDALLNAHLRGKNVEKVTVRHKTGFIRGQWRVGIYNVTPVDNTVMWLCIDIDAHGNPCDVADPASAATAVCEAFSANNVPCYLERSGGGAGWHVWVFFEEPTQALDARRLAWAVLPTDIPLVNGHLANARRGMGFEIFPKQSRVAEDGYGNLVWLPAWCGARPGCNQFHDPDTFAPYDLSMVDVETVDKETLHEVLNNIEPDIANVERLPIYKSSSFVGTGAVDQNSWKEWRAKALGELDLDAVYGEFLTGAQRGQWMECHDPYTHGDRNPPAGVADGSGEFERGTFHSYRHGGVTLRIFDFMVEQGLADSFQDALFKVSTLSGVPFPQPELPEGDLENDLEWGEGNDSAQEHANTLTKSEEPATGQPAQRITSFQRADHARFFFEDAPPREWLFDGMLPRSIVGAVVAEGGTGKTFLTLGLACSLATGRELFPTFVPAKQGRVLLLLGEDPEAEIWRRCRAISLQHGFDAADREALASNLYVSAGWSAPLMTVNGPGGPVKTAHYTQLQKLINDWRPDLIILDPKAQWDGTNENDNVQATAFVNSIRDLVAPIGATAIITHHIAKTKDDNPKAAPPDLSSASARGATGFVNACRWVLSMRELPAKTAKDKGISKDDRWKYVEVALTKKNYSPGVPSILLERGDNGALKECGAEVAEKGKDDDVATPGEPLSSTDALNLTIVKVVQAYLVEHQDARLSVRDIQFGDTGAPIRDLLRPIAGTSRQRIGDAITWGVNNLYLSEQKDGKKTIVRPSFEDLEMLAAAGGEDGEGVLHAGEINESDTPTIDDLAKGLLDDDDIPF